MRALFLKELRQGRPLLAFAAAMALLIPAGYAVLFPALLSYDPYFDRAQLRLVAALAALAVPPVIGIFAGVGLFSTEVQLGTTPILFALPLSRKRIWLAKLLAAACLTAVAGLAVVVIALALLPNIQLPVAAWAHAPDVCCLTLFWLAAAVFCSTLTRSVTATVPLTALVGGALTAGAVALLANFGAWLSGIPVLDGTLWCLLAAPALLFGSTLAVVRGELLDSWPNRLLAALVVFLGLGVTVVLVSLIGRTATRYQRADVERVAAEYPVSGRPMLTVLAYADPYRVGQGRGEMIAYTLSAYPSGLEGGPNGEVTVPLLHRSSYAVALDLRTGRDVTAVRLPGPLWADSVFHISYSPDGKFAAFVKRPDGLTWGSMGKRDPELHILDLEENRELYVGTPEAMRWATAVRLSWSPSGQYLMLEKPQGPSRWPDGVQTLHLLRRDGSQPPPPALRLASAYWSPSEDVVYGFDNDGRLCRESPDGRPKEVIWAPAGPDQKHEERWLEPRSVSPDGRWALVFETVEMTSTRPDGRTGSWYPVRKHLVRTEDGYSELLWEASDQQTWIGQTHWLSDGAAVSLRSRGWDKERRLRSHQLIRWDPGEKAFTEFGPEIEASSVQVLARPGSSGVFLWAVWRGFPTDMERLGPIVREALIAVGPDGESHSYSMPKAADDASVMARMIGFDPSGRLLFYGGSFHPPTLGGATAQSIEALDLETGDVTRVYP